ncbi:MAG: thiolase domain-containing protein [Candidatus Thorarchaeota archaeon]
MEPVNIIGAGMTQFGVLKDSFTELVEKASFEAMSDSQTLDQPFDHIIVGTLNPDEFVNKGHVSTLLADRLGLVPAGATRVESGPSSGSSAFEAAFTMIASGHSNLILVVGVEKMSEVDRETSSKILAKILSYESESRYGATPSALAALVARRYMHDYGLTRDELSLVPMKAHKNGAKNPLAHFQMELTVEKISSARVVADPLTLYDCCPTSDGAAAIVLASDQVVRGLGISDQAIRVLGVGHGTDYHALQHRLALTSFCATRVAVERAFAMANVEPSDIDVYELHDAFSILELVNMEDLGIAEPGQSIGLVKDGATEVNGQFPVNTTGGLKARGHPPGGTGIAQIHDIYCQLMQRAPKGLQVSSPVLGLTQNIGGFGNNMVVSIFQRS